MAAMIRRLRTGLVWQIALGFVIGTAMTLAMRAIQSGPTAPSASAHGQAANPKPLFARG